MADPRDDVPTAPVAPYATPIETAMAAQRGESSGAIGSGMPIDEAFLDEARARHVDRRIDEKPVADLPPAREALSFGDQSPLPAPVVAEPVEADAEAQRAVVESRAMAVAQGGNRVALLPPDEHPKDEEPRLPYMLTERAFHDDVMCRAGDIVMVRPSQRGPHHQELPDVDYPKDGEPIGDWHHEVPRFEGMTTVPLDEHERIVNELKSHHEHELAKLRDETAHGVTGEQYDRAVADIKADYERRLAEQASNAPAGDSGEVARLRQAIAERDAELARLKLMTRNQ